ncbi:hypothetical protein [Clostridium minihomine]|uniref:hypothetical protein n=1 Tax=Clostridium minihomine TaxID=2045012 RepID=UPI000C77DD69|nr:hypothetical protein [Clostridium minihomine]
MALKQNRKQKLKKELKQLAVLEAYNAVAFIALYFFWIWQFQERFSLIAFYPILLCSIILLQGAAYWKICLERVKEKKNRGEKTARIFSCFRWLDIFLLLIYLVILGLQWQEPQSGWLIFGIGMYVFAIIEYFNYYFIRLSYPVVPFFRRLAQLDFGKSQIAKEIQDYRRGLARKIK